MSGVGCVLADGSVGDTSNTYPWSLVKVALARCSVSSQLSQVPHGVAPPAQLLNVPARLTYSCTTWLCLSTRIVVVPPPDAGS